MLIVAMISGLLLAATPPAATEPRPSSACKSIDAALPAGLVSWSKTADFARGRIEIGQTATIKLLLDRLMRYAAPPGKRGGPGTFGGSVDFTVARAGTYRVALGDAAWVDVVGNGKAIPSTSHGHSPNCSSIRKIVGFTLAPGMYSLQISGSANAAIAALVIPGS